ncbi:MAG: PIG-L family deacetylase [Actinobacteria bacterium]|nr:MAG: PIG-L family deacetylase [Actinomycetota bacterium]
MIAATLLNVNQPPAEVVFLIKRILVIAGIAIAALLLILLLVALVAFPLMRYLSRPQDLGKAKRNGVEMSRLKGRTVVSVVAHPDDAEWYAGGALALLKENGNRVVVVVGTSGEQGGNGIPELAKTREAEQRRAGEILGYDRIVFARNPDRGLKNDRHFRSQLLDVFRQEKPDVLITFDSAQPAIGYRHSDHLAAGAASLEVAEDFETVRRAYLFSSANPDVLLEIAPVVEEKDAARQAHESQNEPRQGAAGWLLRLLRHISPAGSRSGMRAGSANPYPEAGIEYGEPYRLLGLD